MNFLLDLFQGKLIERLEQSVKDSIAPLPNYLRCLGVGLALLVSSLVGWTIMLWGLVAGLFFKLSHLPYAVPSLWCALLGLGIGLILTGIGLGLVRRPR